MAGVETTYVRLSGKVLLLRADWESRDCGARCKYVIPIMADGQGRENEFPSWCRRNPATYRNLIQRFVVWTPAAFRAQGVWALKRTLRHGRTVGYATILP